MSIIYNNTNCTNINYDDTVLDKVIYDTTTVYLRTRTVTYYSESDSTKTAQIAPGSKVDLSSSYAASKSGWSFVGWRKDKTASGSVESSVTMGESNLSLYAVYRASVTVSYNGNGATSGSTAGETKYRYYNNGNTVNPSFTLKSNGFARSYYNFVNWRQGSTSGTARNPGSSVTLTSNTIFYAAWTAQTQSNVTVTKSNVITAINNWASVRTLVEFGRVFTSAPSVSISGDWEQRVVLTRKTYTIVTSTHQQGGGTWNVTVTAKGTAYANNSASGIATVKGQFSASINNWQGGSRNISFGRTFKSPPTVDWWSPNPSASALASDWTITISNITTTGFKISWGASTGGATHDLGWIAEGSV